MRARLDQHFLVSKTAADDIIGYADIGPGDSVLEIGPGRGILTSRLLMAKANVTAVEIDEKLVQSLQRRWNQSNFKLLHYDFLKLDLSLLPTFAVVVANLPFSMATPILQRLLEWNGYKRAVLMFQKEVADRIAAVAGSRAYGSLSVAVQIKAEVEHLRDVGADCFRPSPKVTASVVGVRPLAGSRLPKDLSEANFFRVVKASFSQRRKMAAKLLALSLDLPRGDVEEYFAQAGIPANARAETISVDQFIDLARRIFT